MILPSPLLPVPRSQGSKKNISSGFLPLTSPGQAFINKILNIEHPPAMRSVLGWFKDGYILNGLIWTQTGFKALRAGRTFNIEFWMGKIICQGTRFARTLTYTMMRISETIGDPHSALWNHRAAGVHHRRDSSSDTISQKPRRSGCAAGVTWRLWNYMEFLFRSDWTVADSGDAYVLEKG